MNNTKRVLTILACLLTPSLAFADTESEQCSSPQTVIKSVRMFDGAEIQPVATIVIECATILRVLTETNDYQTPADATVIEGQGKTLLPGLIDGHGHIWTRAQLERSLDFGVTTVLDMGSSRGLAQKIRDEETQGKNHDRADLRSAVLWVTAPESHGTQFGEVPTLAEPDAATSFVAERIAGGADYIKIIYDHFKMFDRDIPTLSRDTMTATVAATRELGKMAVFHSRDVEAMANAIEAGAGGFVHVPVDKVPDEHLIKLMVDKGIFVTPNLSLARDESSRLLEDPNFGPLFTEAEKKNLADWFAMRRDNGDEVEYESVITLHRAGVTVLVGSDLPNGGTTAGATVHAELELLVEAGMTPLEALRAATSKTATAYGMSDRGRIAEGAQADLLLVEGKPDQNILDTRRIVRIWKSGHVHPSRTTQTDGR